MSSVRNLGLTSLIASYDNHPVLRNLLTVYRDGGILISTTSR